MIKNYKTSKSIKNLILLCFMLTLCILSMYLQHFKSQLIKHSVRKSITLSNTLKSTKSPLKD